MSRPVHDVRVAAIPADLPHVERLWLEYLTWGNDEMEARHGFRLPVREAVDHDLEAIAQFEPPGGRVLLAWQGDHAFGIGCLRGIGPDTGEIKRMYVEPSYRGTGAGSALLDGLIAAAREAGYARLRLDSPDFLTDAHRLYRRRGFEPIEPYPESEIPVDLRVWWVFMERHLRRGS
jgi:GNAT superfamily N-acetyltransferase